MEFVILQWDWVISQLYLLELCCFPVTAHYTRAALYGGTNNFLTSDVSTHLFGGAGNFLTPESIPNCQVIITGPFNLFLGTWLRSTNRGDCSILHSSWLFHQLPLLINMLLWLSFTLPGWQINIPTGKLPCIPIETISWITMYGDISIIKGVFNLTELSPLMKLIITLAPSSPRDCHTVLILHGEK